MDDVASTDTLWWLTECKSVHYVMDDDASTGVLCGGLHGEHQYTTSALFT
jgi:hypothetical protein